MLDANRGTVGCLYHRGDGLTRYDGNTVMRTYDGFVSLMPKDAGTTWDLTAAKYYDIEPFPEGTEVTLSL